MSSKTVLVLDCGATNVRAMAVDETGSILASAASPHTPRPDPLQAGGLVWDAAEIWRRFVQCTRQILPGLPRSGPAAVTVTTFGVDGAAVTGEGQLLYPVISWQCQRTVPIQANIARWLDPAELYRRTGLQPYHFNTIHKLIWLREYRPNVLAEMDYYAFLPSLFIHRLTGRWLTDTTMAGTSMLTELQTRAFSPWILDVLGLRPENFPPLAEPGTVAGELLPAPAAELGVPAGTPVVLAGHDTQFAVFGAGGSPEEPVLSSGTWEVLMARTRKPNLDPLSAEAGVTVEFDARPDLFNPGIMWVASGVLEWMSGLLFPDLTGQPDRYERILAEAGGTQPGSGGVRVIPELFAAGGQRGVWSGLHPRTSRADLYRACLEALACYARRGLDVLQRTGAFRARRLICVGGGARNRLWNQLRADVLGLPLQVADCAEATVLGAAMFAFAGAGVYASPEAAASAMRPVYQSVQPGPDAGFYEQFHAGYLELLNRGTGTP